ncbi:MAG: TlpA family protein disulfide reductase [Muribaculaceae bacterium]|nr:TlpA family protein disulfide reductase [Muribaculaceae bacterium]
MKLLKRLALAVLLIAGLAAPSQAALPSVGLKDTNGNAIDTATLSNDGKPFVISFFATWCKPCLRELKAIHELYPDWQDETGMRLIAVSIDEAQTMNKVKPLADAEGWEYQVLLDPNREFARQMGVQMVPHIFVFDGEGNTLETRTGYTDGSENHIIELIRQSLNK